MTKIFRCWVSVFCGWRHKWDRL